jgi:hypothetical protein
MSPRLYCHQPLQEPGHIRLLYLEAGFPAICTDLNSCNGPQWKFVNVPLDDPPPYLAISYVWGNPVRCRRLSGSNGYLDVTENVARVLNYLVAEYLTPFYVWIDALCIDQASTTEKRTQLRLMRDVYRNSMQVVGWLGEFTAASMWLGRSSAGGIVTEYSL